MIRGFLLLLICFPQTCIGQVLWNIETGGGGSSPYDPYYNPQFLVIEVGDTVRWTNVQGTHNVDGRIETYPGNPESFFSGEPSQGWIFEHVFEIAGDYGFQCNQGNHAQTQFGVIMVDIPNSAQSLKESSFLVFPNPFTEQLNILSDCGVTQIEVYDTQMRLVYEHDACSQHSTLDLGHLYSGTYIFRFSFESNSVFRKIVKE